MKYIGAHVSASGGVHHCIDNALAIGANALRFLLRISAAGRPIRLKAK